MSLVRKPAGMELIELLDRVLDKGIVVDASSRLHLISPHFSLRKKQVVIESIETFLHHSEARVVTRARRHQPVRALVPSIQAVPPRRRVR